MTRPEAAQLAHHGIDYTAAAIGLTAPGWVYVLTEINAILALLSGIASLSFVVYRFWRYVRTH